MSLGHGASIVRDGLLLHLDAANVKSYPGTGTTWSDLSGNGLDFTITGATFNNTTPKHFSYTNDAGDHIERGSFDWQGATDVSYEMWLRLDSPLQSQIGFVSYATAILENNHVLIFKDSGNLQYFDVITNTPRVTVTFDESNWDAGNWIHFVVTADKANTGDISFYINGQLVTSATGVLSSTPYSNGGNMMFGQEQDNVGGGFSTTQDFPGDLAVWRIYSKVLTTDEININFEAYRGRYFFDPPVVDKIYRYWRINIDDNYQSTGNVDAVEELYFYSAADGGGTDLTGTPIGGSELNQTDYIHEKAFDRNFSTFWATAANDSGSANSWIGLDFGVDTEVLSYRVVGRSGSFDRDAPKDWRLQGSDDGTNWTTIETVTGQDTRADNNGVLRNVP